MMMVDMANVKLCMGLGAFRYVISQGYSWKGNERVSISVWRCATISIYQRAFTMFFRAKIRKTF